MQLENLRLLAEQLLAGQLSVDQFTEHIARRPIADVGVAQLDLDRARRCGFPEVVFGQGKSVEALARIFESLLANGVSVLSTRISAEQAHDLLPRFDGSVYNPLGRTFRIPLGDTKPVDGGHIGIITAGTSDLPVAEEARETANWMGVRVTMIQDVGVAGPHRLPARLPELRDVDAIVVIAGMEGALPSVVGGYVDCPVIGVPTSVGYGTNLGGLAALLSMLNSCAANVTVVNIDAGFKGAYVASLIASKAARRRSHS
ncbi:MAG TPA: nickel pincer cofactor biosynthesis protein LarB [Pirellulales bacterium]|nr:nickel pincer cofactor biosynthesis protein LarB [Pirellulales bacterium]